MIPYKVSLLRYICIPEQQWVRTYTKRAELCREKLAGYHRLVTEEIRTSFITRPMLLNVSEIVILYIVEDVRYELLIAKLS